MIVAVIWLMVITWGAGSTPISTIAISEAACKTEIAGITAQFKDVTAECIVFNK